MDDPRDRKLTNQFPLLIEEVKEYAIFLMSPEGHIQSWNQGAERIKGYTEEEILGKHFSTFYTEKDREAGRPETGLRSAAEEGQWTDEGWRVRKDGSRFWAQVTITALYDEASASGESRLRGFAKVTRDMTERHLYEKELAEQKKRAERQKKQADRENALLRLMQRAAAIANETASLEKALQETTAEVSKHTGWPVGHVYWLRLGEDQPLVPSDIWHVRGEREFEAFRSVTEEADFDVGESLPGMVASEGKPVWIPDVNEEPNFVRAQRRDNIGVKGAFAVPIRVAEETIAVLEFFSPERKEEDEKLIEAIESVGLQLSRVAEREETKAILEESEEKFRTLTESALVGITLIQEGVYEYVNPAMAEMTGYSREELLGASPKRTVHPEDWPRVERQIEKRLEGKTREVQYETRLLTKSGDTRHVEVAGSRITYQGEPALIATVQDVTEQRRMRRELIQVQEEERRRIGQDLHDSIASQLTGAKIKMSLLSSKAQAKEAEEGIQEVESIIEESANDVRKLSHGLNPGGLSEGDLCSALRGLAENTKEGRFEEKLREGEGDQLSCTLDGETATHLYRIAQEAVSNARVHGNGEEIIIRLGEKEDTLLLEVEDNGVGFEPEESDKNASLGLRSMRHRAEIIDAELVIESSLGEGTLVRAQLPL
jgi:PAS domain S-box-containing protein